MELDASTLPARLPYAKPRLLVHGSVVELTLTEIANENKNDMFNNLKTL